MKTRVGARVVGARVVGARLVGWPADEPVETEAVDHLAVARAPPALLERVGDATSHGQGFEPRVKGGRVRCAEDREEETLSAQRLLALARVGGVHGDGSGEDTVGDRPRRAVGAPELLVRVQFEGATEDLGVAGQRRAGGAGKHEVRRGCLHGTR